MRGTLTIFILLIVGCGVGPNSNSGEDDKRAKAGSIELEQPSHDRVDLPGGDATDWKSFSVDAYETDLTLRIWWDNPNVRATVTLYDMFGGQMYSLTHKLGKRKEAWGNIRVRKGKYFVRIQASAAESVYTLEMRTGPVPEDDFEDTGPVERPF